MAQTPSDAGSGTSATLPRGKACLRCRKRKMRCDGAKPACGQCARAKKTDSCQYDDGKGKTRTQALREKISRLEEEIQQMRDPDYASPAIVLHDPHALYHSGSSSSGGGSPSSAAVSVSPSPYNSFDSPQTVWEHIRTSSPVMPYQSEELPIELSHMLLDIFLPHRHQCGLALHPGRLRASLSLPAPDRRHPVLTNAIFLWACFLSRPGSLSHHEQHYLARTQDALAQALQQPHRAVDVVQASCLLAKYFLATGRTPEASYHASAAATLAVHAGLHRAASMHVRAGGRRVAGQGAPGLLLDAPQDAIELGERIGVFWQAYVLDRCLAVALQRQTCIVDDEGFDTRIDAPWPEEIEEYENMALASIGGDSTMRMFFAHQGLSAGGSGGFSISALRVKAAALYERGAHLGASWGHSTSQAADFRTHEITIGRFLTTLLPVHQLDAALPADRRAYVVVHTVAHAAVIELHQRFARTDPTSFEKCLRAARAALALVKHVADTDFEFLDPVIGMCWASVAGILALEQVTWSAALENDVQRELDTVIFALTKLGTRFPFASFQVAQVLETLAGSS